MKTSLLCIILCVIASVALAKNPTPRKATMTWKGSFNDMELQKENPANGVITNSKDFEKLVKAWKVADKVPVVDFDKEIVLVATTIGSVLSPNAGLDEKGDLQVVWMASADKRPGFRYVIISLSKDGVKTVNSKPLAKD